VPITTTWIHDGWIWNGADGNASGKDIPVIYFEAGFPSEYRQPNDHIELVNSKKMANIIRTGYLTIWDLANREWGTSKTE
jgi:hypothetical protein